jgi:flagellar protein FlbD
VILLTRLGGPVFALNPDLVERADCTPDTVITLVDGKKYIVAELISLIRQFRATIVADAQHLAHQAPGLPARPQVAAEKSTVDTEAAPTNVVQLHPRER